MHIVRTGSDLLLVKWLAGEIHGGEKLWPVLKKIRGVPREGAPNIVGWYIQFPARVVTSAGDVFDPAVLHFQQAPPTDLGMLSSDHGECELRLIGEVEEIAPSEYALPDEIRRAADSAAGPNQSRGTVLVSSHDGLAFAVEAPAFFFLDRSQNAGRLRLLDADPILTLCRYEPFDHRLAVFVGDWNEKLRDFSLHRLPIS
jgi:hypothetical protein